MADEFNFEMTTKYEPEFKSQVTYDNLYTVLAEERIENKISQLQRPNENVIDTFYNILLSSRIIAEIEDMRKVVYDYQKEETVPQTITDLSLSDMFSAPMTWKE